MSRKVFEGANVFMSRNLVPPELFDTLHDALKLNGAHVFLCCDPSRNGLNDYHVISSPEHEKFNDLRAKGCKLIGPLCVLSCAKEHRILPDQGFTCCLAMDGVSILASGFEKAEKAKIASMVAAMAGILLTKQSSDAQFVVVKNVLAQKYKWALQNFKKPIVTLKWIEQCWKEHRIVPQEPYRVPQFLGLTICVSGVPADERKEVEKLAVQNGGKYSAELTKRCTHLICVPDSDKYKVAKRWGTIHIVTRKWFLQSVARKACLNEDSYPVDGNLKALEQYSQGKHTGSLQYTSSSMGLASVIDDSSVGHDVDPDMSKSHLCMLSDPSDPSSLLKETNVTPDDEQKTDFNFASYVADDSQNEDDDLYLLECRIMLVGFLDSELRSLVDMIRQGGGSRYMSLSEKLTHIVIGKPTEIEIKEVRSLAAFGVIYVVKAAWLEECTIKRKEVPVLRYHIADDLFFLKDPIINKATTTGVTSLKQQKTSAPSLGDRILGTEDAKTEVFTDEGSNLQDMKVQPGVGAVSSKGIMPSPVFEGKLFRFSSSFPEEQRPEVMLWVSQGGGEIVADRIEDVNFTVERHGVVLTQSARSTYVTTHWIHSCLEVGSLLEVSSHILFSPLQCKVPLPGFEQHRFCASQYDVKEKQLLRNLCYVLGAKFSEKLTKKVTHLLCKFSTGDKYEAACRWGIKAVTADWINECVTQNRNVDSIGFRPKELTRNASNHQTVDRREVQHYSTGSGYGFTNHQDILSVKVEGSAGNYDTTQVFSSVPDVASAIEDLLQQSNEFHPSNANHVVDPPSKPGVSAFRTIR